MKINVLRTFACMLPWLLIQGLPAAPPPHEEILSEIQASVEALKEGDYRGALEGLQFAVAKVQKLLDEEYKKLLPEPLKGWTAEKPRVQSAGMALVGGGTTLSRTYRQGEKRIQLQIMANAPMVGVMASLLRSPALFSQQDNVEPFRFLGLRGMKKVQQDHIEISLLLGNQVLITAKGWGLPDDKALKAYLKALDLEKIRKAFL